MINKIAEIALQAGEIIQKGFYEEKQISYKGTIDLVTDYDVLTENFLKDKLSKLFPNHTIVAEESSDEVALSKTATIYIDPIDGTTNFVHGFPFVSISIGVYNGTEGQYGVVYNPIMNEMFTAKKGEGAFLNGKRINVSKTGILEKSLIATGFPYVKDNLPKLMQILEHTLMYSRGIRRAGSAALDLCYTAKGVFDLYYETTLKPWDIAAGMMIVREAGGLVTTLNGLYHELNNHTIIASNGLVHKEYLNLLNRFEQY